MNLLHFEKQSSEMRLWFVAKWNTTMTDSCALLRLQNLHMKNISSLAYQCHINFYYIFYIHKCLKLKLTKCLVTKYIKLFISTLNIAMKFENKLPLSTNSWQTVYGR